MKLYFYNLDTYGESPKGLCVKECEAEDGEVTFRGTRSNVMAEAVTVLCALK